MLTPDRKEFWGISGPSLLVSLGLVVSAAGAWLWLTNRLMVGVALGGLAMMVGGIVWNLRRGLEVKWRKPNMALHVLMLVMGIGMIGLAAYFRSTLGG